MFPDEIIQKLLNCRKVAILTGAGISAESGVDTFRGPEGLWKKADPRWLATPRAFARDPKAVWEWYEARRRQVAGARPNRGHEVLAWMEEFFPQVTLITQNVDGLHHQAGSRNPVELHGSLWRMRCTGLPSQRFHPPSQEAGAASSPDGLDLSGEGGCGEWEDRHELVNLPPACPQCGALLRPGVVWFEEALPEEPWARAEKAARDCDAFFVVGTSALVYPAAALPEEPLRRGKPVLEINPEATALSPRVTLSLRSKAGPALEALREEWTARREAD